MGYIGNKMSERAHNAHLQGEKPLSEWTKEDFTSLFDAELEQAVKKLTLKELKNYFLSYIGWHHTGKYYNKTDFYELDVDFIEAVTIDKINEIIASRPKREKRPKQEKTKPLFVTAKISYTIWVGNFANYKRPKDYTEVVKFMSNEKMIYTQNGCKRLSSVRILAKIEQKTKFADAKRLK